MSETSSSSSGPKTKAAKAEATELEKGQEQGYLGATVDELDHTVSGQGAETAAAEREQLTRVRADQRAASSEAG